MNVAKQHFSFDDEPSRPKKTVKTTARPKTQNVRQQEKRFAFSDEKRSQKTGTKARNTTRNNPKKTNNVNNRRPTSTRPKKTKLRAIKKWQIVLVIIFAAVVAFTGTMVYMAREDGPVYGDRCEGLLTIKQSALKSTESTIKKRNSKIIDTINISIQCKELKFDIAFKHNATEAQGKKVCYDAVKLLDKTVGAKSYKGSKYSALLNKYNGVKQFECDFYLTCPKGSSWPIYGTKMAGSDKFNFSDAKIKNKTSYNKAQKTTK